METPVSQTELLRMARIDWVEDELRRDLEVLTHDETC